MKSVDTEKEQEAENHVDCVNGVEIEKDSVGGGGLE